MVIDPVVGLVEEDGRRVVRRLAGDGFEMTAAGWVQPDGAGQPSLYIASPWVDAGRARPGYQVVDAAIAALQPCRVRADDVRLVDTRHPVAIALQRNASWFATPSHDTLVPPENFSGLTVERPVFIYALPALAPAA